MLYDFKNKKTGEVVEKLMKIADRDLWLENNPEWEQTYTSVPTVVYVGGGWEKNERNEFAKGQKAMDNSNYEYDALQHDFEKGTGIYKDANESYKRQEDKTLNEASKNGVELG